MFASYSIEYYLRKNFLQARLLDEEKKKVENINLTLEERVEKRTAQLVITNKELKQEITERQRAENALRESEEKYRILVDSADAAIFIAQDGVIKFPNPMTLELTQYSANELAQMPFTEFIHPQDRDMVLERHRKRLKGEEALSTYDFRIISKNGNLLWVHINPVLITWEGRPGTLNFLRDITSQKKLEAQLRQAQKMEAIGTLAGGVAHDLNNILSGLVSYPELVLLDIPEESPLRKPMLTIQKAGQKAAAIVQDMLTLARRGVSVAEVVNLNQIIRQYLASLECEKLLSFHPGAKVETELEANLLNILGSPVHLSKTIMNLVSNAAEAMPEGGTISISTQSRYLDKLLNGYETIDAGEYVILTVADIGTGISPAEIDKIFEPFYTKKAMGRSGTGLGMAVVWGTIKDHKGYIHVDSDEGKGTTIELYFPVTRKPIRSNDIPTTSEKYKGEGQTILVVDDVKEQREIAAKILTQLGYSVETVSSGEKAFEYLESKPADLIVLDMIMLPGIDGLETYKKIISKYPQQRAIIASGFSETDRVREAQRLGAGRYVKKPYTIEKIGMAVKSELSKPQKAA
jgi:PAS domain S-box-containing protein